ncbi:trypsin-1-like [Ostrinia furnacalis]|uniref:trypsin-1-like n=1 Tax=Ostrinia furnacalis TaxID=93504 RepID=UPI001040B8FD|nr:trypsin-1-like [Ostrinia furnacalis]XP_028174905.1 trypsin-1-like [Ostrinia furnacalis]XP_028174906.1 trypsin-1-like [Ostrinia furnacalis]
MKLLLLLCAAAYVSCHSLESPLKSQDGAQDKGFIDWITNLLGGPSTTLRPVQDPPDDCPVCQCGIARTRRRIVGGYETKKLEFPWMAVLMYNGRFYCGGSLINDLYVLTAAHCTAGFRKEKITVRFLEHDRSVANETKIVDRSVAQIIRHLRYNPSTYDNDIALLKLSNRVDLSSALKKRVRKDETGSGSGSGSSEEESDDVGLRPVCLPTAGLSYSNYSGVVAGWGTTEEGGSVSNTLQEVYVPIISNADCRKTAYKQRITENMLCAGEPDGGRDACQGDSGGPLHIVNTTNAQFQEVGVVSWGEGCARPDRPGVYTRVNRYMTWIKSNTRDACYCQ